MPESAPRQGRFRYRLSWLLVLITLTCLFFGRQTYLARQQERALTLIEQAGGHPSYSYELDGQGGQLANPENPYPAWLRSMLGEEHFRTPVRVGLSDGGRRQRFSQPSTVTPEVMAAVGNLRHLEWIELSHNETVDDHALRALSRHKQLNTLYLHNTKVTGVGFGPLSQLPIEYLDLSQSPVTDEGLEQIARLRRLKYLGLEKSDITDAGMAHLAALHGLEDLRLSTTDISDAGLTSLENLSRLKSLSLLSTKVSAEGVARLASALPKCEIHHDFGLGETPDEQLLFADREPITKASLETKLKSLGIDHSVTVDTNHPDQPITSVWLSRTTLSNRPLLQLVRGIPQLETLSLHNTFAGDELLPGLKESSQLRILVLRGGRFTPAGLESLHEVESLRELELHQMPLTDNDVEHLRGLSQLESLFIEGSRISSEGARALRKHLPGCRVTVR